MSSTSYELVVARDRAHLSDLAAERCAIAAEHALRERGQFTIALSGGSTPRDLFHLLAMHPWEAGIDWTHTRVFWGDERCVPPDHPDSNYRFARELLLEHVPVPAENVVRMKGELLDRDAAAAEYAGAICRLVPVDSAGVPRFDLMLQGMGSDGHTASLLPGSILIKEQNLLVAATDKQREGTFRLTVTPPILNHAALLLFLVSGADKADALREVLEGEPRPDRYPAQIVRDAQGQVVWIVDPPAAAGLSRSAPPPGP